VALVFIILTYISAPAFSSCKSDLKKVAAFSKKAVAARNKGDAGKARYNYKRAARKLSAMKYTCSNISLLELAKKERHYRSLAASVSGSSVSKASPPKVAVEPIRTKSKTNRAKSTVKVVKRCGAKLPRARQLIAQGNKARRSRRNAYYAAARDILVKVKARCPRTSVAARADKLLVRVRIVLRTRSTVPTSNEPPSKKKDRSRATATRKSTRSVSSRSKRYSRAATSKKSSTRTSRHLVGQHARRNSCEVTKLTHIYTAEQQAYKALSNMQYVLAADRFIEAIHGYESNSHKCPTNKSKLAVLDRIDRLTKILRKLKQEHIHCAKRLEAVRDLSRTAYNDENSGEFELAQEGYVSTVKAYETMPQVCASRAHSRELNENRAKRDLLACSHYIEGIKEFNKGFNAISKAQNKRAVTAYRKAFASFNLATKNCSYNLTNRKILRKLKLYSTHSIKRLGKR